MHGSFSSTVPTCQLRAEMSRVCCIGLVGWSCISRVNTRRTRGSLGCIAHTAVRIYNNMKCYLILSPIGRRILSPFNKREARRRKTRSSEQRCFMYDHETSASETSDSVKLVITTLFKLCRLCGEGNRELHTSTTSSRRCLYAQLIELTKVCR